MDDVFDLTGRPPSGWMHAIFNDGPFEHDVGRCVPGPPAADPLIVCAGGSPEWTYRIVTIGSWSDPLDPIAIYAAKLPAGNETGWWADRSLAASTHDLGEPPDLVRCWIEFDVTAIAPPESSGIRLDGGGPAYRLCSQGVGVTGYELDDCLQLIRDALADDDVPPVRKATANVDLSALNLNPRFVGVPVWRGIWYPPLNRSGPTL